MKDSDKTEYSSEDIQNCVTVLERLARDGTQLANLPDAQRIALMTAAGRLSRPDRDQQRKRTREKRRVDRHSRVGKERRARAATGIRRAREHEVFTAPKQIPGAPGAAMENPRSLNSPRNCYVCKALFTQLHHFYDAMHLLLIRRF